MRRQIDEQTGNAVGATVAQRAKSPRGISPRGAHGLTVRLSRKTSDIRGVVSRQGRISVDPKVLVGKPVVKGARIAVELVVDLLAQGWTQQQILDSYPNLTAEDLRACLAFAADCVPVGQHR